jgi:hypothetical protein
MPADQPRAESRSTGPGLASRLFGVVTSPRASYADIAARPRWLGALLVVLAGTVLPTAWILSTEVGQQAVLDQQLQTLEAFGQTVSDAQYERMVRMAPYSGYAAAAGQLVGLPVATVAIAGIAFGVLSVGFGGSATFRQVFAVVSFSSVLTALRAMFSTPLNYARESLSSPTSLAAAVPLFEDNTFGARLLGSIDLFHIWWIVNLAIGIGVLYRRRTGLIATTMLVTYGAIALVVATIRSVLAGA